MLFLLKRKVSRYKNIYQEYRRNQRACAFCFENLNRKGNFMRNEVFQDVCCVECRDNLKRDASVIKFRGLNIYSEYLYQDDIRLAILQYKQSGDKFLACVFLHPYWSYFFRKHVIVLVPSTQTSEKKRGFNHVELLAQKSGFTNVFSVFEHRGEVEQALKKTEERKYTKNEIVLIDEAPIRNKNVLILDDIITSGSTVLACEELLKAYAQSIDVLTIARSPQLEGQSKRINLPF